MPFVASTRTAEISFFMEEIWKQVMGYEWLYEVSSLGKVRSLKFWKYKILKSFKKNSWHSSVRFYLYWIYKKFSVHRLVATHFIPNLNNLPCVCHKIETLDENGFLYNWVDNLWWWTYSDNVQDMLKKWRDKYYIRKTFQYSLDWKFIKEWCSLSDVKYKLWIHTQNVHACCKWKVKSAWWFVWKYQK